MLVAELPGLAEGEDIVDWSLKPERPKKADDLWRELFSIIEAAETWEPASHTKAKETSTETEAPSIVPGQGGDRPVIVIEGGKLAENVQAVEEALIAAGEPMIFSAAPLS